MRDGLGAGDVRSPECVSGFGEPRRIAGDRRILTLVDEYDCVGDASLIGARNAGGWKYGRA